MVPTAAGYPDDALVKASADDQATCDICLHFKNLLKVGGRRVGVGDWPASDFQGKIFPSFFHFGYVIMGGCCESERC